MCLQFSAFISKISAYYDVFSINNGIIKYAITYLNMLSHYLIHITLKITIVA